MNELKRIVEEHSRSAREHQQKTDYLLNKIRKREEQIHRLKKRLAKLGLGTHYREGVILPIAEIIAERLIDYDMRIIGPSGIGGRVSMVFKKKDVPDKDMFKAGNYLSLTFEAHHDDNRNINLSIVDYTKDTGEYPPGTVGEINGFNHPLVDMIYDVNELIQLMVSQSEWRRITEKFLTEKLSSEKFF